MSIEEKVKDSKQNNSNNLFGKVTYCSIITGTTYIVSVPLVSGTLCYLNEKFKINPEATGQDYVMAGIGIGLIASLIGYVVAERICEKGN